MGARHFNNWRTANVGNTDEFPSVDIRVFRALGVLSDGQKGAARAPYEIDHATGLPQALFLVQTDFRPTRQPSVTLTYHNWNGHSGKTTVDLLSRVARLGGRRWYFKCPVNGSRCEKLYLTSNGWMSRTAAKLVFRSQSEGYWDRLLRRRDKLTERVKGSQTKGPLRGKRRKQAMNYLEAIDAKLEGVNDRLSALDAEGKVQREIRRRKVAKEKRELEAIDELYVPVTSFDAELTRSLDDLKREAMNANPMPGLTTYRSEPRIVDNHLPCIDLSILQRLRYTHHGSLRGARIGWTREKTARPHGDLYFAIDLTDRRSPCAMMILTDDFGKKISTQLFWLQRLRGVAGRYQFRFICPKTDYLSRVLLYKDRQFSTPAAIFGDPDKLFPDFKLPKLPW